MIGLTAADVEIEQMIEGGLRLDAAKRLTGVRTASSALHHPGASISWIATANGWQPLTRKGAALGTID